MKTSILHSITSTLGLGLAAWTVCVSQTGYAWQVEGTVLCPNAGAFSGATISVTGTNVCEGAFSGSATTDATGHYLLVLPECAGSYTACLDATTLPGDATIVGAACQNFSVISGNNEVTVNWTVESTTICGAPCVCVNPNLGLGSASGCTVLELGANKVSITGPAGGILGNVCIAPGGSLDITGSEFITGTVELGAGATFHNSTHSSPNVQQNADLSTEISDAYAAYNNALNLSCMQTFGTLDGSVSTISGSVGLNVICVKDVSLHGKQVHLTGPAGTRFVVIVRGNFVLTGGGAGPQIRAAGGVTPSDILYVIVGTGSQVAFSGGGGGENCCAAIVDGTLLAPYRNIALSPGLVNGEVISGRSISIVSGSSVRCPCP
ncbi:MAG TPA: hypothetical protein VNN22_11475 [Verrucomicrobiae bacterium]|nr:hypothetical protein [Verrucomicrobiae bacterium]